MVRAATVKYDLVRQVGVERGVVDLAYYWRQFGKTQRYGEFVVKASRNLDLEPALRTADDL
jgi:hypothetical protein